MVRFSVSGTKRRAICSDPGAGGDEEEEEEEVESEHKGEASCSSKQPKASDSITVRIDPDVFDCPICYETLSPPIFQCCNGHVICSSCRDKMKNKCFLCPYALGPGRCLALEKVIESIKVACVYAENGCQETLSYTQRDAHKENCDYSPCFCPFPDCKFEGYVQLLSYHYTTEHVGSTSFKYNEPFCISFSDTSSIQILLGEDGILYVVQNSRIMSIGNSFAVSCIHPRPLKDEIMYELIADSVESSLRLSGFVLGTRKWTGVSPSKEFLLVPHSFSDENGYFHLEVCIRRSNA